MTLIHQRHGRTDDMRSQYRALHYSVSRVKKQSSKFTCLFRTLNTLQGCTDDHSTCKIDQPSYTCTPHYRQNNQAVQYPSCCSSLQTLHHCTYQWTSLFRRMSTHDLDLHAVQLSRNRFRTSALYSIHSVWSLKHYTSGDHRRIQWYHRLTACAVAQSCCISDVC